MNPLRPRSETTRTGRDPAHALAFTLVELLVAMSVTALVLVTLLQLFSQAMTAWNRENKRESSLREARSGLRLLADDLGSLHVIPTTRAGTPDSHQSFILIPPADEHRSSVFAFLRTSRPRRSGASNRPEGGDLKLVVYAVALSTDSSGSVSQKLWRGEMDPASTLRRIEAHLTDQTALFGEDDWASLVTPAGYLNQDSALGKTAEPVVYDLIRCVITPLEIDPSTTPPSLKLQATDAPTWANGRLPAAIEIRLRVTNRATATLLANLDDWLGLGRHAQLITGSGQTVLDPTDDPEVRTHTLRMRLPQSHPQPP